MNRKTLDDVINTLVDNGEQALVKLKYRGFVQILRRGKLSQLSKADREMIARALDRLIADESLRRASMGRARKRGTPSTTTERDFNIAHDFIRLRKTEKAIVAKQMLCKKYSQKDSVIEKAIKEYRAAAEEDIKRSRRR